MAKKRACSKKKLLRGGDKSKKGGGTDHLIRNPELLGKTNEVYLLGNLNIRSEFHNVTAVPGGTNVTFSVICKNV